MLHSIPHLLTPDRVRQCRQALERANWVAGDATAGHIARKAKHNRQLAADDPLAGQLGELILGALADNPLFISAALPFKVFPPRFNRYEDGGHYGNHVDGAILSVPGTPHRVRTDLSATLFFSEPDEYDGGDLIIEDTYGVHSVKLPAGHLVLYPGTSLHRVAPVTRGVRLAAFFWIQSLVREDSQRGLLFNLDSAIQQISQQLPESPGVSQLTGIYHNLLRQWSET